jgi:FdhD protein
MNPVVARARTAWAGGAAQAGSRLLAEEAAVAITYNRETFAVMMASPADLPDFAIGFSLSEGVIETPADVEELDVIEVADGLECRMWLAAGRLAAVRERRRRLAGPTGCGLCGIDSLREAVRPPPRVTAAARFDPAMVGRALAAMQPLQALGGQTRAVHAAALWAPDAGVLALREDVGRHNALDKLVGAVARAGIATGQAMLLLSSRVSIEMVQKACVLGAPVLVAISAPTAHAVRLAEAAGLTLVAVARPDGFEVFCGGERIVPEQMGPERIAPEQMGPEQMVRGQIMPARARA